MSSATDRLSQNQAFEVLKSPRRRYALYYLRQQHGQAELSDLTDQVAAWENRTTTAELTSEQRKRVYISLYQTHLPKLDEADVVDYDQNSGEVNLSSRADELDIYLGDVSGEELPWDRYYLGLSIGSMALITGFWLRVYPFSRLSWLACAIIVLAVFSVSAVAHYVHHRRSATLTVPPELNGVEG